MYSRLIEVETLKYPRFHGNCFPLSTLDLVSEFRSKKVWNMEVINYKHYFFLPFLAKCGPKKQNYLFKMKFGTDTNLNMLKVMVMFTFFWFGLEIPFLGKFSPKNLKLYLLDETWYLV